MTTLIKISSDQIYALDLSPVRVQLEAWGEGLAAHCQEIQFELESLPGADQALELPEIPEIRLWFIRLDSEYPWLPFLLDWQSGELVRYAAMLVPHEFSPKEGIQFNPQALDIFVMQKIFVLVGWLRSQHIQAESKLKQMGELFGYELDSALFDLLRADGGE